VMHVTCGAWTKAMFHDGNNPQNATITGFRYWILYPGYPVGTLAPGSSLGGPMAKNKYSYSGSLFGNALDSTPNRDPDKPAGYWPVSMKYVWGSPGGGWTVTYPKLLLAPDPFKPEELVDIPIYIGVWRGISLHTLVQSSGDPTLPPGEQQMLPTEQTDEQVGPISIDIIPNIHLDDIYPPIF